MTVKLILKTDRSKQTIKLDLTDEQLLSVEDDIAELLANWREARLNYIKSKK